MSNSKQSQPGPFAITKVKMILLASILLTWWFAHMLPHYEPIIRAQVSSRLMEARQKIPKIKVDWKVPEEPESDYNSSKVALIIEPRPLPHLVPLILHMVSVVPPDWRFVFIGSDASVFSVSRAYAIKHQQVIGKLDLMVLPDPWEIKNKEMVYRMLTDMRFYDEFLPGVEWILKYESDSILCANSPQSLNEWLDWSWAGAPRSPDDRFSGNGGLSLRTVSSIRRVLKNQARRNNSEPEDEWFGRRLWVLKGAKVTSGMTALAVENIYMEKPMGFHIPNSGKNIPDGVWKNQEQRKKILEYCPEVSLIMDMKMERERCDDDDGEGKLGANPKELKKSRESVARVESASKASAASVAAARASAALASAQAAEAEAARTREAAEASATATPTSTAKPGSSADNSSSPKETSPAASDDLPN